MQQGHSTLDEKLGDPNIKQIFWVSGSRDERQIRWTGKDQKHVLGDKTELLVSSWMIP